MLRILTLAPTRRRMTATVDLSQLLDRNMRVDLRRANTRMTQHLLYLPKARAVLQH